MDSLPYELQENFWQRAVRKFVGRERRSLVHGNSVEDCSSKKRPSLLIYTNKSLAGFDPLSWKWTCLDGDLLQFRKLPPFSILREDGNELVCYDLDETLLFELNCVSSGASWAWRDTPPAIPRALNPVTFFAGCKERPQKIIVRNRSDDHHFCCLEIFNARKKRWEVSKKWPPTLESPTSGVTHKGRVYLSEREGLCCCFNLSTFEWDRLFYVDWSPCVSRRTQRVNVRLVDDRANGLFFAAIVKTRQECFVNCVGLRLWKIRDDPLEPYSKNESNNGRKIPSTECVEISRMPSDMIEKLGLNVGDVGDGERESDGDGDWRSIKNFGVEELIYFCREDRMTVCVYSIVKDKWKVVPQPPPCECV